MCHSQGMADHPTMAEIDLLSGGFWAGDHHTRLTWMRANAPVYWDGRAWGVTRYQDVREVSMRTEVFSSAQGIRPDSPAMPMMIDMDDPAHFQRRKLVNRGFTPRRVRDQESRIVEVCDEIIDKINRKRKHVSTTRH